jgi:hypothetical protein
MMTRWDWAFSEALMGGNMKMDAGGSGTLGLHQALMSGAAAS